MLRVKTKIITLLLTGAVLALPLFISVYGAWLEPRPFFLQATDVENDYYYNALRVSRGLPPWQIEHPGTPIFYAFGGILRILGNAQDAPLSDPQLFFNIAYILIGIVSAIALAAFLWIIFRGAHSHWGLAILLASSIMIWPMYLNYLNYLSPDAFMPVVMLPVFALFWSIIMGQRRISPKALVLLGAGVGLAGSIKLSIVPIAIVFLLALFAKIFTFPDQRGKRSRLLTFFPLGAFGAFFLFTIPIISRYPQLLWKIFAVRTQVSPRVLASNLLFFVDTHPVLAMVLFASIACFLFCFIQYLRKNGYPKDAKPQQQQLSVDFFSGGVAIILLLGVFLHAMALTDRCCLGNTGIAFRQLSPAFLVFPLLLHYCYLFSARHVGAAWLYRCQPIFATLGIAALILVIPNHFDVRRTIMAKQSGQIAQIDSIIAQLRRPSTRVAIWSSGDGVAKPRAAFHFWGNHAHAQNVFDNEILSSFPEVTFYQHDIAYERYREAQLPSKDIEPPLTFSGRLRKKYTGTYVRTPSREVIVGEQSGIRPSLLVIEADALKFGRGSRDDSFMEFLKTELGNPEKWRLLEKTIGGDGFVFMFDGNLPDTLK